MNKNISFKCKIKMIIINALIDFPTATMSAIYKERVLNIENLKIDQNALRQCCLYGIPETFRPLVWRLFFGIPGYLSADRQQWMGTLDKQRKNYANLVENFVNRQLNGEQEEEKQKQDDHPLALEQNGDKRRNQSWICYFKDNDVLKQIDNDVRRTRPEVEFFQKCTQYPVKMAVRLSKRVNHTVLAAEEGRTLAKLADKSFIISSSSQTLEGNRKMNSLQEEESEKHWEVMERILYIYAKVNVGVSYTQGMNELLGPIYYVFATDSDVEWAKYAEPDSFYCFQYLLAEMQDIFIQKMDTEHCGFEATLLRFYSQLQQNDPEIYFRMVETQQIKAEFFAFRWISLLLTQEFCLADLIALWDHLFASKSGTRLEKVQYLCLAMLEFIRDQLIEGDFTNNLKLLQNFPQNIDVSTLIYRSVQISEGKTFVSQYELRKKSEKNGDKFPRVISSVKSRFTTPLKSFVDNTTKKLAIKMGGNNGKEKLQNLSALDSNDQERNPGLISKHATL